MKRPWRDFLSRLFAVKSKGITLVELAVGLAIVGILAVLAVPEFTSFMRKTDVRDCAKRLASDISMARVNAQSAGQRAVIVVVKGASADLNNDGKKEHYFMFLDANRNDAYDSGETTIARNLCNDKVLMETSSSPIPDCGHFSNAQCIRFSTLGTMFTDDVADGIIQMKYDDGTNNYKAKVTITTMTGHLSTQWSEDGGSTWQDF
jgi:prepilin-type N-terminal cleavage/methylation domain-containing protein